MNANKNELQMKIKTLYKQIKELQAENKELIINEQLEEVQANLNDYVHN